MKKKTSALLAVPLVLAASGAAAQTTGLSLSLAADYAEGKYGTPVTSKQWTIPIIAKYEADKWNAKVTVPYVRIENPAVSRDGTPLPCAGNPTAPRTASGLGDVVVSGTVNVLELRANALLVDLTGKVKFGTADEAKCLGTGENDYSIQGDVTKSFGAFAAFGSLGWRKMGDPPGVNFKDPYYFSVGGTYKLSDVTSVGVAYDFRQRLLSGRDPVSEATVFVTQRINNRFKVQGYVVGGFSDSSPDWALGAVATWAF